MMRKLCCALLGAAILGGCGGGGGTSAIPRANGGSPPVSGVPASAHVVISVPPHPMTTGAKPAYVSPSTQSVTVQVDSGSAVTQNIAPNAPNCTNAGANYPLDCTVTVTASAGAHTLTFATYDQPNAAGNELSINDIAVTFVAGQNPAIPVALAGVPASITVVPAPGQSTIASNDPMLAAHELQWTWGASHQLLVYTSDADGNYIVGPGSPTISFSTTATDGTPNVTFSAASATNANLYTVQSTAPGYGTFTVTATPSSPLAGSALNTTIAFASAAASAVVYSDPTGATMGSTLGLADVGGVLYTETVASSYCGMASVTLAGAVSDFAGASACGFADGTGAAAAFYYSTNGNAANNGNAIENVAYDTKDGNLYIADTNNCAIRQVTPAGVVTTIAGSTPPTVTCYSQTDGTGGAAGFYLPNSIAYDPVLDAFFVGDQCEIREVTPAGVVTTLAGSPIGSGGCGFQDSTDGTGATAKFAINRGQGSIPGITFDSNDGQLYVTDPQNCVVRRVDPTTGNTVTIAGVGPDGRIRFANCNYADAVGRAAKFKYPESIVYDPDDGKLYVGDNSNHAIRQLDPVTGVVVTIAGPPPPTALAPSSVLPAAGIGSTVPITTAFGLVYDHATTSLYVTQGPGIMQLQL